MVSLASPADVYARAVDEGSSRASLYFAARFRFEELTGSPRADEDNAAQDNVVGVTADENARFSKPADLVDPTELSKREPRPTALLVLRAERGTKVVRINATFSGSYGTFRELERTFAVRRNELVTVPLAVRAEALFSVGETEPYTSFESFARADRNEDGVVDPAELAAARPTEIEREKFSRSFGISNDGSLVDLLGARMQARLFRF